MAIYKKAYSGLITKGLGGSACCGLVTLGFGLFSCVIGVYEPPFIGGGGSYPIQPGIYVPWRPKHQSSVKTIQITIKIPTPSKQKVWRKAYTVAASKADLVVRAINIANAAMVRLHVGINDVKHVTRRILTTFTPNKTNPGETND